MTGLTPTTDEGRADYVREEDIRAAHEKLAAYGDLAGQVIGGRRDEFDSWLAAHDREVAARAWAEGYEDGGQDERIRSLIEHGTREATANPYREEAS